MTSSSNDNASNKLSIREINIDENELIFDYYVDSHQFRTEIYYGDINFANLKTEYGSTEINKLVTQIAAMTGLRYCSLAPQLYDLSEYSHFLNKNFKALFQKCYKNIYAQHRYENNLIDYEGPDIKTGTQDDFSESKITINESSPEVLAGCGGGKDSLLSMRTLEQANIPYSTFQYSHSVYGKAEPQHEIIDNLLNKCNPKRTHKVYVVEDFLSAPVIKSHFGDRIKSILGAETPTSIFQTLPLMLKYGYTNLCLGHEKSADKGNLYWDKGDENINHQWGKSYEAENVLNNYISNSLIFNYKYFSILKPIHDYLIFNLLKNDQEKVPLTSSCNIEKPWCKRCPKCAYVFLGFAAYLDRSIWKKIFNNNLLAVPELKKTFLEIIGYRKHKPFECIGEIGEARLFVYDIMQKGISLGEIEEEFEREILPKINIKELRKKYGEVYDKHNIPERFAEDIISQFKSVKL